MRTHERSRWFLPVSLLTFFFLLTAVPAFADPHGSMHHDGHYQKHSHEGHSDHHRSHHDGMHEKHGAGHHAAHSSGHGKPHHKGYGGHGYGSTHPGKHQNAAEFIRHILKFKEGMSLTAEQEQKLRTIKVNYKKDRITLKAEVDLANIDLHQVLKSEKASLADIEAEFNKLHALKTKLYMVSIKAKWDAKAALSKEQRMRMDKIHERIKSHGSNRGHAGDYSKYKKSKDHGTNGRMH